MCPIVHKVFAYKAGNCRIGYLRSLSDDGLSNFGTGMERPSLSKLGILYTVLCESEGILWSRGGGRVGKFISKFLINFV